MKKQTMIALLLSPLALFAQQRKAPFDAKARFMAEAYDVIWTMPGNMTDLNTEVGMTVKRGYRNVGIYGPVLESKNKDCLLMYSEDIINATDLRTRSLEAERKADGKTTTSLPATPSNPHRGIMKSELMTVHGYRANNNFYKLPRYMYKAVESKTVVYGSGKKRESFSRTPTGEFRLEDYVTIVSGKKARRWFNADSVFLYTLPVDDPYKEGYTHCTGMVITKKDRAGIELKLYFTDAGKKKEAKYIRSLRRKIRYRNDDWQYDRDVVKQATQKYYGKEASEE